MYTYNEMAHGDVWGRTLQHGLGLQDMQKLHHKAWVVRRGGRGLHCAIPCRAVLCCVAPEGVDGEEGAGGLRLRVGGRGVGWWGS